MSIYSSIPGLDDEHQEGCGVWVQQRPGIRILTRDTSRACTCGRPDAPYRYHGSHILPSEGDPRGGSVGLALIPSHITRDGRDDQPADGTPWPWLRVSVDVRALDPAAVLNRAQVQYLRDQLTNWLDSTEPNPPEPTAR